MKYSVGDHICEQIRFLSAQQINKYVCKHISDQVWQSVEYEVWNPVIFDFKDQLESLIDDGVKNEQNSIARK